LMSIIKEKGTALKPCPVSFWSLRFLGAEFEHGVKRAEADGSGDQHDRTQYVGDNSPAACEHTPETQEE
jgi:hypothetical protein